MNGDEFLKTAIQEGALVSAGVVRAGWGRPPFLKGKMIAHYWAETGTDLSELEDVGGMSAAGAYGLKSACGLFSLATTQVPLLGAGNLPFCTRCENKLMKLPAASLNKEKQG